MSLALTDDHDLILYNSYLMFLMNLKSQTKHGLLMLALSVMLGNATALETETAIWHCSKMPQAEASQSAQEMSFSMASVNGTIDVSLDDLLAAYSGYPIRISGKPLFACFLPGQEALSTSALQTLGLSSAAMQMLARRSAIVQRNLKLVTDEVEMQQCLEKNSPAFGYLSKPINNEKVAPCF
jgi:hypothetical protein